MSNPLPTCPNAAIFPELEPSLRRLLSNIIEPEPLKTLSSNGPSLKTSNTATSLPQELRAIVPEYYPI